MAKPYYKYYQETLPFTAYKTQEFDAFINDSFNSRQAVPEVSYLIHYTRPTTIEPYIGWALDAKNEVLQFSLPYGASDIWLLPHYIFFKKKKYLQFKTVVSIRYNWFNYWHFYNDVIGQLYQLELLNFDKSIPIIIPKKALEFEYATEFLETAYAKKWKWIYQDLDTYIKADTVFFCKSIPNIKEQFLLAGKILGAFKTTTSLPKRIYLKRAVARGRHIANSDEIEAMLREHNFEIIDAEEMSLATQAALFSAAEILVGPHGAGLTNIFFRFPRACTVIEIFPEHFAPVHYYYLAKELDFKYMAIMGGPILPDGSFELDKRSLELAVDSAMVTD